MVGKQWTTAEEKARIITYAEMGLKVKDIAAKTGRSRSTIYDILKTAKTMPTNTVPQHKRPTGRPRLTSKRTDNFLRLIFFIFY